MSYCVNCGVELGEDLKCCPLCGTPVINPNCRCPESTESFFPTRQEKVKPVNKTELALLISAMLLSVALCCGILNLILEPGLIWSLYAAGACCMLWVWTVLPLLLRKLPVYVKLGLDILSVALYLLLIAAATGSMGWYLKLALPILASAELISIVIAYILRGGRRSLLGRVIIFLIGSALLSLLVELFVDLYFYSRWSAGWSLIVMTVCLGIAIPLITVRCVPSLREEVRRRFHM